MKRMQSWTQTLLVASALLAGMTAMAMAQSKDPIRIGLVTSQTGGFAEAGADIQRGAQFAADEANAAGGVDGRKVDFSVGDDESTPDGGRRVGEKLARAGYKFLSGPISSAISLTLTQNLDRWDALLVDVAPKSDKLTGDTCKPRYFRANQSDAMDLAMVSEWAKGLDYKTFDIIASDYVWGRDSGESFARAVKARGSNVAVTLFTPLLTKDYSPYIAQLKATNAEAIWVAEAGRDAIAFIKQAQEFGLIPAKKIIGHVLLNNYIVAATGNALEGAVGTSGYVSDIDTPENKVFVAAFQKQFNRLPTDYEAMGYHGIRVIYEGVRKAGSVDPKDVAKALAGSTIPTIFGPVKVRAEDHQMLVPNFVARVKMVGKELRPQIEREFGPEIIPAPSPLCKM